MPLKMQGPQQNMYEFRVNEGNEGCVQNVIQCIEIA